MEASALGRKARTIRDRAWDIARTLDELERTLPPDLLERLGEVHGLMAKLRVDLTDPELQGWVVLPKNVSSAPPLDFAQLLRSRPLPEVAAVDPHVVASFSSSVMRGHDAAVAMLLSQLPKTNPHVPHPPAAPAAAPAAPPASLAVLRAAFATGEGL